VIPPHPTEIRSTVLAWLGTFLFSSALAEVPTLRGLSRSDLLQTSPVTTSTRPAKSPKEWETRRKEALESFQQVAGRLPGGQMRCKLDLSIDEEVDCGTYVRRLVSYASSPGGRVPAYLCIPKAALAGKAAPAVLCLHPTDDSVGHGVVVGLGGKPNRQYAAELAEQGFVTLSPNYPLLAKYQPDLKTLGFTSGTMKAVWDNIRGLDLLETLPSVRKEAGFAAIGHSLGGHNSIFTAAFEPRLRVVVSSCGFDSFLDYKGGNIKGWVQERYMLKMGDYLGKPEAVPFDFYELVAALAPRPFLANAPIRDSNFSWESVDRIAQSAKQVYALHSAEANVRVLHPECDHDFPDEARNAAYTLIRDTLGKP
jgi:hypothetical protein